MNNKHNITYNNSKIDELLRNHENFFDNIKPEDENLNDDIISYTNPENRTNDRDIIDNAIDTANKISNLNDDNTKLDDDNDYFISSFPNSTNTGMM